MGNKQAAGERRGSAQDQADYALAQYTPEQLRSLWLAFYSASTGKKASKGSSDKLLDLPPLTFPQFEAFIRQHFEAADDDFVGRLFAAFDDDDSGSISFIEAAVALSVLEMRTPTEKLKFLFKLFDGDGDGFIDTTEVVGVKKQLVATALYLHSESDPEIVARYFEGVIKDLDSNGDGMISLEEWVQGGIVSVPLLRFLGVDKSTYNPYRIVEGVHEWRVKHWKQTVQCNICHKHIALGKATLVCNYCGFVAHKTCAAHATSTAQGCRGTFVEAHNADMKPVHHWVDGNVAARCFVCQKYIKARQVSSGTTCSWCKKSVHKACQEKCPVTCDLGNLCEAILPAIWLLRDESDFAAQLRRRSSEFMELPQPAVESPGGTGVTVQPDEGETEEKPKAQLRLRLANDLPSTFSPLAVFVNAKSGAQQGIRVLRKFRYLLNPRQVFTLSEGGPRPGLELFAAHGNFRVVCCGGDGTAGWILSVMDDLIEEGVMSSYAPTAILPLGTGNDLARCLNWGGGYEGEDLGKYLQHLLAAQPVALDRWSVSFTEADGEATLDKAPLSIVNNYFSIGVDAAIALRFHTEREANPAKFTSRARNKMFYAQFGASEAFNATCTDLPEQVILKVDGKEYPIPSNLEGIAILNIPSMYGGSNLWGGHKASDAFDAQNIGDELIEVVGIKGSIHAAQIKGGFKQHAKRIAQGKVIEMTTKRALPMQIDGEPWMQAPSTMVLTHANQAQVLRKCAKSASRTERRTAKASIMRRPKRPTHKQRRSLGGQEMASTVSKFKKQRSREAPL